MLLSLKDLIEKHKVEILEMNKAGKNKAEITRHLITNYGLDIPFDKVDSLRRGISLFIQNSEEQDLQQELNTPINELVADVETKTSTEEQEIVNKLNNQDDEEDEEIDEEEFRKQLKGASEHKEKYWYVSETDNYYFNIPSYQSGLKLSGTLIRELKNMYSHLGRQGGMTINQICRAVKLPRLVILYIKTYLGWTHDSDPFTNEEMLVGDIDEMVDRTLEDRRFQWFQKYTRKEQKLVEDAANKWWQFKGRVVNPFLEKLQEEANFYQAPATTIKLDKGAGDPYALVCGPFDLHFGKYAWEGDTGSIYNREKARKVLLETAQAIIREAMTKNIERVFIPVGSDFFHVDTIGGTTTRGTPQDQDGQLIQIMHEGNKLMVEFVDMMRQVADVELILAAGNHDYVLSHQLLEVLSYRYENCADVTVNKCFHFRQYAQFGTSLLGFTHGDETKIQDLPFLMATEAPQKWANTTHRAYFTGHLHHEMCKDHKGVKVYQMPSLAGTDRWHHKKGYVGSVKGLAGYLVHKEKGVRITIMENI